VPAAPTDLQAIVVQDALKISLMWEDTSDIEDEFIVERSTAGPTGPWSEVVTLPADTTMYNDSGLTDGVTYWYRIAATNTVGTSGYSNVVSGTATALPQPPLGDASCDGNVTSVDAALVLQFDAGVLDDLICASFADVNGSGSVNAIDASLILQFDAGLIDAFTLQAGSGAR